MRQGFYRKYAFEVRERKISCKILDKNPTSGNYYDAACLYSIMNEKELALKHLDLSFQKGYRDFNHIKVDDDMDNIRELPEFKNLVQKYGGRIE